MDTSTQPDLQDTTRPAQTIRGVRAVIPSEQVLRFEEFELGTALRPTEVLVEIERTIISAGTELANYTGLDPDTRTPGRWCAYPWNPGYGGIGRVMSIGADVDSVRVGDRVYGRFLHATHAVINTAWQFCVKIPESLDSTMAAFVRMGNVAISALQRAQVSLDDPVVVIGLGLVGNLAGQFFLGTGQRVIGLDLSEKRRQFARQTGFHAVLDPSETPTPESLLAAIKDVSEGRMPRAVVEAVGDSRLIELGIKLVANNGQVIMLGTPRAPYETNCTPFLDYAHRRGISIVGALEWTIPLLKKQGPDHTTESNAELILRLIESGRLQVGPLCSHVIAPAELNDAYQGLLHHKDRYLGVVVDWQNNPAPAQDFDATEFPAVTAAPAVG
jgi:2-desacetyl-2-hydroxyethyl bacteriochlorophyllide A dehydrogenase